jgi:hypothetical protein
MSVSGRRCVYKELGLARLIEGEEPKGGLVNGFPYSEDAVVLEDGCFAVAWDNS